MRNQAIGIVSLSSLTIVALTATAADAQPAWCKGATESLSVYGPLKDVYAETDPLDAVYTLVAATCFPDGDARAEARQLEATRRTWSKRLEMTEGDWADAAVWASRGQGDRNSPSIYPGGDKAAWSSYTPIDQYAGLLNSTLGDSSRVTDPAYLADAFGARLSEAGRLGYITRCLGTNATPVEWAMCEGDIAAFDPRKLSAELRADTAHDGFQRMVVRIAAYQIAPKLAQHAAAVKALTAKDPGYAQMFALAGAARSAWSKTDPALIALATQMDDARVTSSRKASEGCAARTWDAWKAVVSTVPAARFAALRPEPGNSLLEQAAAVVIGEANGYLASLSLHLCESFGDKPDYLIRILGAAMSRWPGFRGPRTAAHTAILTAGITLDDRDARIEYPDVTRPWISGSGSSGGGGTGGIASVKASGETTTIEFAKVKSQQKECTRGHTTNRITQIRSDGTLVYQYVCEATRTVTINEPPAPPQTVKSRYAAGLKKGMFVSVIEDVVVVAYAKSGAAAPSMIAGVPVK
jgi:hypothetical protein